MEITGASSEAQYDKDFARGEKNENKEKKGMPARSLSFLNSLLATQVKDFCHSLPPSYSLSLSSFPSLSLLPLDLSRTRFSPLRTREARRRFRRMKKRRTDRGIGEVEQW